RRGSRSDASRRLPARVPGADRPHRLPHLALRPLRRRLHPRAHRFPAAHAGGPRAVAAFPGRGLGAGGEVRRAAFGGARRAAGEHGDGQAKAEFLPIMYGPELMQAFREFKQIWDPQNRMNPNKLIDPRRADDDLRWGPQYKPVKLSTKFGFESEVGNGFTRA